MKAGRKFCTAHGCLRPLGMNGFFCAQDWARLSAELRTGIEKRVRAQTRGEELRELVRQARRTLAACKTSIVKTHASAAAAVSAC